MPILLTLATGYAEVKGGAPVAALPAVPLPAVEETTEETTLEEDQSTTTTTLLIQEESTMAGVAEVEAEDVVVEEEGTLEPIS